MQTSDFNYELPPELIAQQPAATRDGARLLVYHRATGHIEHSQFVNLPNHLRAGDLLIFNDSKVLPARLRGVKVVGGGAVELLLLEEMAPNDWWTLLRPAKSLRPGGCFVLNKLDGSPSAIQAELMEKDVEGRCRIKFLNPGNILDQLAEIGELPLPPYISREAGPTTAKDLERYQTVFAHEPGSVAAPTAGLHFTPETIQRLAAGGIQTRFVTLHVGAGTFAPVKTTDLRDHRMHEERYFLPSETASAILACRSQGGRVVAVGTTSLRVLESAAESGLQESAGQWRRTRLFVHPPRNFRVVGALLTNFHLPQSTLLMLVSAFLTPGGEEGREKCLTAYQEAVRERYRFFSYGDAMFIS